MPNRKRSHALQPAQASANRLLAALPRKETAQLRPHLEKLQLGQHTTLYEMNKPIKHLYFLTRGVASIVTPVKDERPVESATVGPEGVIGIPIVLGAAQTASRAFIQVSGEGFRIEVQSFKKIIGGCRELNRILLRYTLALLTQVAQNAACNRMHSIEERCARWLLMTHDRVHKNSFSLTQDFLAQMIGVRRPSVSIAASILAKAGLIDYVRGDITVLDRAGLEAASCECYKVVRSEFERLLGTSG